MMLPMLPDATRDARLFSPPRLRHAGARYAYARCAYDVAVYDGVYVKVTTRHAAPRAACLRLFCAARHQQRATSTALRDARDAAIDICPP